MRLESTKFMSKKLLFVPIALSLVFAASSGRLSAATQDLDTVYQAATRFWSLIQERKRFEASKYFLNDDQRSAYTNWQQDPPVISAAIKAIRFTDNPNEVIVQATTQIIGPKGQFFNRNVEHKWVYAKKRWFLDLDISESRLFAETGAAPLEKLMTQFKNTFRLVTKDIEVAPDAFGKTLEGAIDYEYTSSSESPVEFLVASAPDFLKIFPEDLKEIAIGGKIRFVVLGRELLSNENIPPIVLRAKAGPLQEDYTIPVSWKGKAPYRWTFDPPLIENSYTGEVRLSVTNQSDDTWSVGAANSTNGTLELVSFPDKPVKPGEAAVYTYRIADATSGSGPGTGAASPPKTRQDSIVAYLNGPVPTVTIRVPYPKPVVVDQPISAAPPLPKAMMDRLIQDAMQKTPLPPVKKP